MFKKLKNFWNSTSIPVWRMRRNVIMLGNAALTLSFISIPYKSLTLQRVNVSFQLALFAVMFVIYLLGVRGQIRHELAMARLEGQSQGVVDVLKAMRHRLFTEGWSPATIAPRTGNC